jgi:hypothetical protein
MLFRFDLEAPVSFGSRADELGSALSLRDWGYPSGHGLRFYLVFVLLSLRGFGGILGVDKDF